MERHLIQSFLSFTDAAGYVNLESCLCEGGVFYLYFFFPFSVSLQLFVRVGEVSSFIHCSDSFSSDSYHIFYFFLFILKK
jgi:hypothetical protein